MHILGISAFYHDSAAALLCDGAIVAAAQEERFTRRKHDSGFPARSIEYCVRQANIGLADVDWVVFYDKPFLKFERLLETYVAFAPKGFSSFRKAMPLWLREKLFLKDLLLNNLESLSKATSWKEKLLFSEHHFSHAASAYFPSPFQEAAVLTMDGVGEWATTSLAVGRGNSLDIIKEIHFPHSLGLLYSAFTYYTGFKVNSGEYKLMGLAPYGNPRYVQAILDNLIDVKPDGSFRLNLSYFDYCTGLTMTNEHFHRLFGGGPRRPETPLAQREMDLAASIQAVTEEVVLKLAQNVAATTGQKNLCLAGGVALNCVANGKLLRNRCFDEIWIQPAAGDAGGALGAAFAGYHHHLKQPRRPNPQGGDAMKGAYLGPGFSQKEIEERLSLAGARYEVLSNSELIATCANELVSGRAVGWFQGRMEFGPRALGARSILGDPRSPTMQTTLNLKVKFRESFRPFAPSILAEDTQDWFDLDCASPYMQLVAMVGSSRRLAIDPIEEDALFGLEKLKLQRSEIPAVTHVDFSSRVQTVHRETNPRYHSLLESFKSLTGCPVLINTSFNVRGEPIVCTPEDAFRCFMGTNIEVLVVENCLLRKDQQDPTLSLEYQNSFDLD